MSRKLHKLQSENGTVMKAGFLSKSGTVVTLMGPNAGTTPTVDKFSDISTNGEYQPWGPNNNNPTEWRQKIEGSTTAYPLIAKIVSILFGKGICYYKSTKNADGTETKDFTSIPEVDEFLNNNDINFLMLQRAMDFKFCNNIFSEFILNNGKTQIVGINHLEAEFTRFGKLDADTKKFINVLYTGDWANPRDMADIPFLNRQDLSVETIKEFDADKPFVFHSYFPSPGRTIYAFPPHGAIFKKDGWLDYANSVPEIMNKINANAMNIKFHIKIPYEYWETTVKDWQSLDQSKRDEIIDAKLQQLEDFLVGKDKIGKSFYSHFATDPISRKALAGWVIEVIDDPIKKDMYLTSLQEADIQLSRALNVDSSLSNIQPQGGKMGAGSGSDKRVGMDNQVSTSYADVYIITEPLRIVGLFNGWPPLNWGFMHEVPTTLNEDPSGITEKN